MEYRFEEIGILRTCFKEKFGIPRQSGLVKGAHGVIHLKNHPFFHQAVRELDTFSHLWVVFVFHQHDAKNWKPSIRPPRLGGAKKVGVLASRSPHRPNPIGLSVVKLEKVVQDAQGGVEIHVSGVDILDGTPVLDIKPYLPYADSIQDAHAGWAEETIKRTPVEFSDKAIQSITEKSMQGYPNLKELIIGMLELDPRPAFQKRNLPSESPEAEGTCYGFRLFDFDVKWQIKQQVFIVLDVIDFKSS
jgi:tRNA-Thr(GGU) m(6)t(6)A37 methyltransferase TsaA